MTPSLASAILTAFRELLVISPQLVEEVKVIFARAEPTAEDWDALKAKITAKGYFDYVPDSDLPKPAPPA